MARTYRLDPQAIKDILALEQARQAESHEAMNTFIRNRGVTVVAADPEPEPEPAKPIPTANAGAHGEVRIRENTNAAKNRWIRAMAGRGDVWEL